MRSINTGRPEIEADIVIRARSECEAWDLSLGTSRVKLECAYHRAVY